VLPKTNFAAADLQAFEENAKRVAAGLRERAARGEDPDDLQREGYAALGFIGLPPATQVGMRRRADLPAEAADEVFSLRPGETSRVESETFSFVIYKVDARSTRPLDQVRQEIAREIARQKLDRALQAITGHLRTEWNEKYFGSPAQ
jgi:hypothetical protein